MIITLTGTPGTGKTTVADKIEGYDVLGLSDFIKSNNLGREKGEEIEVDIQEMVDAVQEEVNEREDLIIEGHLAHHINSDYCIVLRCRPDVLRKRLTKRDYSEQKINENIESEILDIVLSEAVGRQKNILEIDTTTREPNDVASEIERKIEENKTSYGEIDWTNFI